MKHKQVIFIAILVVMLLLVPNETSADAGEIAVIINGKTQEFDVPPVIVDGRTLVPVRHIFEVLGANLEWDSLTRSIKAQRGSDTY